MKLFHPLLCLAAIGTAVLFADDKIPADSVKVVSPDEVAKLIAEKKATVLDIRTPEEFSAGHIPGAVNIDFLEADFPKKIATLDKSKTYIVHCGAGSRSGRALPAFLDQKFPSLLHLQAGFKGWESAGKPVEKK